MFNRKRDEIDRLNARCVELAEMVKEKNDKINELDNTRIKLVVDNKLHTRKQKEILEIIESNSYGRTDKQKLDKIKEVIVGKNK